MKCLDENEVVAFLDGQLDDAARARVEAHIAECASCRQLLAGAVPGGSEYASTLHDDSTPTVPGGLLPPRTVLARYVIQRMLGAGGMGVVYAAHDPQLNRNVALKLLRELGPGSAALLQERLLREARAMAQLRHPNVVTIHDVGIVAERVFVVMELIGGSTLRAWLAARPRTFDEILAVFRAAGEGLAAAHAAGLVHRDVKPENILVAHDGQVLVTDFGLARAASAAPSGELPVDSARMTLTGAVVGTPAYMAPEQIDGGEVSVQSDIFSFCVALYEALCGQRPFAGDTLTQIREAITRGQIREPPRDVSVPTWLRRVLARGLSANSAARPRSMRELVDALARNPARRRRAVAVAIGALTVIALGGAFAYKRSPAIRCRAGGERFDATILPSRLNALSHGPTPAAANSMLAGEAAELRRVLIDRLTRFRQEWIDAYRDACLATHDRAEQSEDLLDRRMSCLDEQLAAAGERATLLERRDVSIDRKLTASDELEALAMCGDRKALLAAVAPPVDRALRARVAELRNGNARVSTLVSAGEHRPALERARAIAVEARATNYSPIIAEAVSSLGTALAVNGNYDEAALAFDEAILIAESAHDDRVVAVARLGLVQVALTTGREKDLYRLARDAEGAVRRVGEDSALQAWLLGTRAAVEEALGHFDTAEALLKERIEFVGAHQGLRKLELGIAENNLGVFLLDKRPAEALQHFDRAWAIEAPLLGAHSPDLLLLAFNRATVIAQTRPSRELLATTSALLADSEIALSPHDIELARVLTLHSKALMSERDTRARAPAVMRRALAIYVAQLTPDHPERIRAEGHLAEELLEVGQFAEAEPHSRIQLSFAETHDDPLHNTLRSALCMHGRILDGLHRTQEAKREIERAVSLRTPSVSRDMPRSDAREDFALAQVVDELGDRPRALKLARSAEAGFLKATFPDDERLAAVRTWLAAEAQPCATVDARAEQLIVEGTLSGKKVRVLIDTGAAGASLSPRLARQRTPIPFGDVESAGATGVWKRSHSYSVSELQVGGVRLSAFQAHVIDEGLSGYDVAIGTAQLSTFIVTIDLRKNRFCLDPQKPAADWHSFTVETGSGITVLVPVQIGKRRFERFIFDTGAGVSSIAERLTENLPHRKRTSATTIDASGVRERQRAIEVDDFCLFGDCHQKEELLLDHDMSEVNGFQTDGILGMPFFKGRRVLLDFSRKELAIQP
jgi:tetratricopeptide (TPR) repeat protein